MQKSTQDFIKTLDGLVETCKDGEQGFREAAEGVQRSDLRSVFNEYSRQRAQFANELQIQVARIGGDPPRSGSVGGSLHRGWINLKSAITGKDDHAILDEAERGEDVAVKSYQDALADELPSDLRSIVEEQYRQVLEAHANIRALRDMNDHGVDSSIPIERRAH